jgi:hypothetical protein
MSWMSATTFGTLTFPVATQTFDHSAMVPEGKLRTLTDADFTSAKYW